MEYRRPRAAAPRSTDADLLARARPLVETAQRAKSFVVFFLCALLGLPALADRLLEAAPLRLLGVLVFLTRVFVLAARAPVLIAARFDAPGLLEFLLRNPFAFRCGGLAFRFPVESAFA